jgi:hypothetical protein
MLHDVSVQQRDPAYLLLLRAAVKSLHCCGFKSHYFRMILRSCKSWVVAVPLQVQQTSSSKRLVSVCMKLAIVSQSLSDPRSQQQ